MCVDRPGRAFFEPSELDRLSGAYPLAPTVLRHALTDHPLLTLSALADAAGELPAGHVERRIANAVNGGEFAMDAAAHAPVADTIRAIGTSGNWIMLRFVQNLPRYREFLHAMMAEIEGVIGAKTGPWRTLKAFVFISAPGTLTPFHFDAEYNILFQIAGDKDFATYPPEPPFLPLDRREAHHRDGDNMLPWHPEYHARAMVHRLAPGDALYVPHAAPHWVRAGSRPSVSLSLTWQSDWSLATGEALAVNPLLRAVGLGLSRPPVWPRQPTLHALAGRAARRAGLL